MSHTAKQIARQRVQILFQQAAQVYKTNPQLAQRYVTTARKIAMAARTRLPPVYGRRFCRSCNAFLVPGWSSRVRIKPQREPHVVVTCLKCGCQKRIPLKTKKKEET
ncbi:MAG: ribonuclease P protein component 4 [Candidatus Bathyarchaeia archaeon]